MNDKFLIVANFKDNLDKKRAEEWLAQFTSFPKTEGILLVLAPAYPLIPLFAEGKDRGGYEVGAQDVSGFPAGAYTGEVSAETLVSLGVTYAFVGHSERRKHLNETNELVEAKIREARRGGITPILGVQTEKEIVAETDKLVVMFEPIEAISSGGNFHPVGRADVMRTVTGFREKLVGDQVRYVYGGSVQPEIVSELLTAGLDGLVVGQEALRPERLREIIDLCQQRKT